MAGCMFRWLYIITKPWKIRSNTKQQHLRDLREMFSKPTSTVPACSMEVTCYNVSHDTQVVCQCFCITRKHLSKCCQNICDVTKLINRFRWSISPVNLVCRQIWEIINAMVLFIIIKPHLKMVKPWILFHLLIPWAIIWRWLAVSLAHNYFWMVYLLSSIRLNTTWDH